MIAMKKQLAVIQEIEVYRVTTNSDRNEGRGATVTVGLFLSHTVASEASVGVGVQGLNGDIKREVIKVVDADDGKMYMLGDEVTLSYENPRKVRERALSKLTEDECRVLGITK